MKMSKVLKVALVVLAACLVASLVGNVVLYLNWNHTLRTLREEHTPKTYVFTWDPYSQIITPGVLYLNISFDIVGDEIHIIARINDNDTGPWAHGSDLAQIAFDKNRNGKIDGGFGDWPYYLGFSNITYTKVPLWIDWPIYASVVLKKSHHHTCWFTEGVGMTYNITFTKQELNIQEGDKSMPVHFFYFDENSDYSRKCCVYIQFAVPLGDKPLWTP